jgi:hypothetical protein
MWSTRKRKAVFSWARRPKEDKRSKARRQFFITGVEG